MNSHNHQKHHFKDEGCHDDHQSHHHHHHDHHHNHHGNKRGLMISLIITIGIVILQVWGSIWTGSLALLSDSFHMFSDALSLLLSFIAVLISVKSTTRIGGYTKFELGATLFNAFTLMAMPIWVMYEAVQRAISNHHVAGFQMVLVAIVGLAANLLSAWALIKTSDVKNNLNVRSAYLHVLVDAWSSAGVIVSGIIVGFTSWFWIDPLFSFLISCLIFRNGWGVLKRTIRVVSEHKKHGISEEGGEDK